MSPKNSLFLKGIDNYYFRQSSRQNSIFFRCCVSYTLIPNFRAFIKSTLYKGVSPKYSLSHIILPKNEIGGSNV